jgi:hypothetical protein
VPIEMPVPSGGRYTCSNAGLTVIRASGPLKVDEDLRAMLARAGVNPDAVKCRSTNTRSRIEDVP